MTVTTVTDALARVLRPTNTLVMHSLVTADPDDEGTASTSD
jgi:hypothetical protein